MAYLWGPDGRTKIPVGETAEHFASLIKRRDYLGVLNALPDPDPILRKAGKGISALRDLLVDSHLESVWGTRLSSVSGRSWEIVPGADDANAIRAAGLCREAASSWAIDSILDGMMEAVAYGFSPAELIWVSDGSHWLIEDVVPKPVEWFAFGKDGRLQYRDGLSLEDTPPYRFVTLQHRSTYANPWGVKQFSKVFWPVTFKRNGWKWWTSFVERFGSAFITGYYPANASADYQDQLFKALESMINSAVGIAEDGTRIEIKEAASKGSSGGVHEQYIAGANAEISKAILGQTLTTEIGDNGSYAAARTHNEVRQDLARRDRARCAAAFSEVFALLTRFNLGEDVATPQFQYQAPEDLKADRAERDEKLYAVGWRPNAEYISEHYSIPTEQFGIVEVPQAPARAGAAFTRTLGRRRKGGTRRLRARGLFRRRSKEEREEAERDQNISEFGASMLPRGQAALDRIVDAYLDAVAGTESFEEAFAVLADVYPEAAVEDLAHLVDEIRYAAGQIGAEQ